jgi:uncharacterized membrane protein (UPF0127 family)
MDSASVRRGGRVLWRCELADSFFKRLGGLMFRTRFEEPLLFVFERESRQPIHSLFCFVDFDAIYLDSSGRIVDLFKGIRPFTPLVTPSSKAKYLIEAPSGSAGRERLKVGSRLEVVV